MNKLYYTPPPQKIFEEVKQKAIEIWQTYDDTYEYSTQKIDKVKSIKNYKDNMMYIIAMFDVFNQNKLGYKLSEEARKEIRKRFESNNKNRQKF